MSDRIEKTIELNAPVERVWRALTDHTEFGAWFQVKLDGPFVLGGVSTGHITYPGYEHMAWRATVTRMEPTRLFAFTWPHPADPGVDDPDAPCTLVEFRLEPTPTGTRLHIVESGFDALPPDRRTTAMRRNEGGWTEQVVNIQAHVDAGR
jgi:uncharacterized protein YndB with AHSA1/START domain